MAAFPMALNPAVNNFAPVSTPFQSLGFPNPNQNMNNGAMNPNALWGTAVMLAAVTELFALLGQMMNAPAAANNYAQNYQNSPAIQDASPNPARHNNRGRGSAHHSGGHSQAASGNSAAQQAAPAGSLTGSDFGNRFAKTAESVANKINTPGLCLKGVNDTLQAMGLPTHRRPSAYMALDDFRKDPHFKEVQVSASQLDKLPAGAVVIWDKGQNLPHGHISVALGDGREASSRVRKQLHLNTQFHVFLPR